MTEREAIDGASTTAGGHAMSRRQMLMGAAAAVASVPALYAFPFVTARASGPGTVSKAQFQQYVGTTFQVGTGGTRSVPCRLESVTDLQVAPPSPPPSPGGEGFSLVFSRNQRLGFGQGTHVVSHPALGSFSLLMVPIGPASAARSCEVVINRLWS